MAKDADAGEVFDFSDDLRGPGDVERGVELLALADELISHNILKFDLPALRKLYPNFQPKGRLFDILIAARLVKVVSAPNGWGYLPSPSSQRLGINPLDLATVISYETGGTFDPWQKGPRTQWGEHRGLIQWGEAQRQNYGVTQDMTVTAQVEAPKAI